MGHKLISKIKQAAKPVKYTPEEIAVAEAPKIAKGKRQRMQLNMPVPATQTRVIAVSKRKNPITARKVLTGKSPKYVQLEVRGSGDKVYTIVVPASYKNVIPKTWRWNPRRYKAADMIGAGHPITQIAKVLGMHKSMIYAWLQHPEFKGHVNGLVMETGWANKQERIAGLNKVTRLLFDKVVAEIDGVNLTDKSIGPVLTAIQTIAKQIAQEKDEFVEQSKVEQNTNLSGVVGIAIANIDTIMASKSAEERRALEAQFKDVSDDVIRGITGEKE